MKKKDEPYSYGGQAVMEGVMMRGRDCYAMAVRKPNGEIHIEEKALNTARRRAPFTWPLVRGVVAFIDSMATGVQTLSQSAEIATDGLETDEPPSRFERFLQEKLGDKLNKIIVNISVAVALCMGVGLFMLLPTWIGSLLASFAGVPASLVGVIEGLTRIAIFLAYVSLISLSGDIRRVFQYHGAEHKTLNCFENTGALTAESVAAHSRLHKRCGTSFLLVVMLVSMVVFLFVRVDNIWLRFGTRILLLPVIAGLSYEISVKWAGRHDNWLVRLVIAPGLWLQRITTAEPDAAQIETAIAALNAVLAKDPAA